MKSSHTRFFFIHPSMVVPFQSRTTRHCRLYFKANFIPFDMNNSMAFANEQQMFKKKKKKQVTELVVVTVINEENYNMRDKI